MFEGALFLLARDHQRELQETAVKGWPTRELVGQSDEVMRRRAAAERRLLRSGIRRG